MVVSVTLDFMLYAFVKQSEGFKNVWLLWLTFYLKGDFVCVYVFLSS